MIPETVAVVAHDAGGAELLAHLIRRGDVRNPRLALAGPALSIFSRVLGNLSLLSLEQAIAGSSLVLTGTSWASDIEWRALKLARDAGIRSATFLDHWVNYAERFIRSGVVCLPDEIWVADEYAELLARREFIGVPVVLRGNPYLDHIIARTKLSQPTSKGRDATSHRVLIVTEPISAHALRQHGTVQFFDYTEFDALAHILDILPIRIGKRNIERISLRPHPSESPEKYYYILENDPNIFILKGTELLDDILDSTIIIGCNTMALIVALAVGKRAVSCIPAGGRNCILPHTGIEHWRNSP